MLMLSFKPKVKRDYNLKKIVLFSLFLLVESVSLHGQDILLKESFETDGHGSRYTVYPRIGSPEDTYPANSDGGFYGSASDYVMRTTAAALGASFVFAPSGMDGDYFWAFEDTDDNDHPKIGEVDIASIQFDNIDISGYANLDFSFRIAAPRINQFDNGSGTLNNWDSVSVFYRIDAETAWTRFVHFTSNSAASGAMREDTNLDGIADGNIIGTGMDCVFETVTKSIAGTGSQIDILVVVDVNGGSEELALDYFVMTGVSANTAPVASSVSFSGTLREGEILNSAYTYTDSESDTESGSTYRWLRSDNSGGSNKTVIGSATATTYTLTSADVGKYVSFEVTPNDGTTPGTAVESSLQGPIDNALPVSATISVSVFLEGAYNGTNLNTTLNSTIATTQPYTSNGHAGGESVGVIPANAVDWVLVELRQASSATTALNSTKVGSAAGFLLNDGSIKATNGTSNLSISLSGHSTASFFMVIYHRNHLPIMSAAAVTESGGLYSIDFTSSAANAHQTTNALVTLSTGKFAMVAGDADGDGDVDAADLTIWRNQNGKSFNYNITNGDFNLDGVINAVDRNDFQRKNSSKTSQVPSS